MKTRTVQLGETLEIAKGKKAERLFDHPSRTTRRYLQIEDLRPDARPKYSEPFACPLATQADVIIAWDGANAGTVSCNLDGYIGSTLAILRPRPDAVFPPYLSRYLEGKFDYLQVNSTGATIPHISRDILESLQLPLPSLPEQRRIAGMLEQADRLRRTRRYALDLSDAFLPAAFLEMFGDPVRNPKGWEKNELGDQVDFLTSGSRGWAEHYVEEGDVFIRIQNVGHGQLILDDLTHVRAPDNAEAKRTRVRPGDVLLSITADLGRSAWIPDDFPTAYINQHLALIRQTRMNPVFLSAQLGSHHAKRAWDTIDRSAVKSGLNFDDVRGFTIMVPPLPFQQRFADLVRGHERLRAAQRESLRQAEHLFQSLLQRAFEGEL